MYSAEFGKDLYNDHGNHTAVKHRNCKDLHIKYHTRDEPEIYGHDMNYKKSLGITDGPNKISREELIKYINLKLSALGCPIYEKEGSELGVAEDLIRNYRERSRLFTSAYTPCGQRIQNFLNSYFSHLDDSEKPRLPKNTFALDYHGLAREMSLPPDKNEFHTDIVETYRVKQGVLHNPKNDRRTTKGVFHIAEGGLPIPPDKKAVPRDVFAKLFAKAFYSVPEELMCLPFTSSQEKHAKLFVSLLLRPLVCPEVKGVSPEKRMEVRFFAPGNLVANLDFVESIFGNAGNPALIENDSALDVEHWTGHTGCVILAPHLLGLTKKELGLPHISEATPRQIKDGMAWESEDELYNDGSPYKITCRDDRGVIVTIITDNYFGYCKKEVKTQIGYSANLFGLAEEEHAGGAMAFPCYQEGETFSLSKFFHKSQHTFENAIASLGDRVELLESGYARDNNFKDIFYLPEDAQISLPDQEATWEKNGQAQTLRILPGRTYVYPNGYKVHIEKHPNAPSWRLVGTRAEGTLCHKPCTVSGGGKSEISKSIWDAIHYDSVFISDFEKDLALAEQVINYDYSQRLINPPPKDTPSRKLLSVDRSLGSVIKMLTPSSAFTREYNDWLSSIPNRIKALVFTIKRFYKPEWGEEWKEYFSVNYVNGEPGHKLHYKNRELVGLYLRVAVEDNRWRTFKLRQDFIPSSKIQWEDDISASVVIPAEKLNNLNPDYKNPSVKIVENCEFRFFQRPDDAVIRGYDKQAEKDLSTPGTFISNFEPLNKEQAHEIYEKAVTFVEYTEPMRKLIKKVAKAEKDGFVVASDRPRIVDGAPTKNPRYLQIRPDVLSKRDMYLAEAGYRLHRNIPSENPVHFPVNAVLPGRRNNPAEPGIRPLAVYNPIHYQELPELFMEFICSLTGKSPSTTGAGSEGALTKGPFNALTATSDLNNALLSFILTGYHGFSTAAGYIGKKYKVEHDVSLLVPELWCRLGVSERSPQFLTENKFLEKLEDFEYEGRTIKQSRLGYRITKEFCNRFMGRIFDSPASVFPEDMLKPELQSMDDYVDGINNITENQERVAKNYIDCGSVEAAIPPLKALFHIMAYGEYEGLTTSSPEFRAMFERENVINSDWYKDRLDKKVANDLQLMNRHKANLDKIIEDITIDPLNNGDIASLNSKREWVESQIASLSSDSASESLIGTLGLDPLHRD